MKNIITITFLLLVAFNNLKAQDSINCSSTNLSLVNFKTTYLTTDSAITLAGLPSGGQFYGNGVMKNKFYPNSLKVGTYSIVYVLLDSLGCSSAICETATITKTAGIDTAISGNYFYIYPNPFKNTLSLKINLLTAQTININIYDLTGMVKYTQKYSYTSGNNFLNLNLDALSEGLYLIRINYIGGILTNKIVKIN